MVTGTLEKTLERRQRLTQVIEQALAESPDEASELITAVAKAFYSDSFTQFWNFLAALSGCDRGYGADWFFTACELHRQRTGKEIHDNT